MCLTFPNLLCPENTDIVEYIYVSDWRVNKVFCYCNYFCYKNCESRLQFFWFASAFIYSWTNWNVKAVSKEIKTHGKSLESFSKKDWSKILGVQWTTQPRWSWGKAATFLLVRKFPPRGLNLINGTKNDPNKPLMKTNFLQGLLFLLHCHLQAFVNLSEGYSSSMMRAGTVCWQMHFQTCVVLSFTGLACSFPERICQTRVILTLNF